MTDWSLLGGNPAPGDPGGIHAAAAVLRNHADTASQQSRLLRGTADGGTASWQGPAASGFRSTVAALDPALQTLVASHHEAADALTTFAAELGGFQATAHQLLGRAQQAHTELLSAQSQVSTLTPQVEAARAAYNHAASEPAPKLPPGVDGPVADPVAAAAADLSSCSARLSSAQSSASTAQSTLSGLGGRAAALHGEATAAAQRCADKLTAAAKPATSRLDLVVGFLESPQFAVATGYISIPGAVLGRLEEAADKADGALAAAQKAETDGLSAISQAARDMRLGETLEERSLAAKIVRASDELKADWTKGIEDTGARATAAEEDLQLFNKAVSSSTSNEALLRASKVLNYSWRDAAGKVMGDAEKPVEDGAETAAEDGTESVLSKIGGDVPVVGSLLTAGFTGYDLAHHHYVDAAGDVAGFGVSVAVTVALASNPVGWAVLGGVAAGVLVNEGIDHYKAVLHVGDEALHGVEHAASHAWHDLTSWL